MIWLVTIFSDITVMARSEKAGERIIFDIDYDARVHKKKINYDEEIFGTKMSDHYVITITCRRKIIAYPALLLF